jgi:hypothetical protein
VYLLTGQRDELQLISPQKIYDICYSNNSVTFEIRNKEGAEVHEKIQFTIRKSNDEYIFRDNRLIRKSDYERIQRQKENAERQRRIEAEEAEQRRIAAEKLRLEQEQLAEEAEQRRIEALKLRLKQEQLAEEKRRKEHVDAFLAERETDVYEFSNSVRQWNNRKIEEAIIGILSISKIDSSLQKFSITDDVLVDYNGKTKHSIVISGLNNPEISKRLTATIETLTFAPEQVTEPYTKEQYSVNTYGNFRFEIHSEFYEKVKVKSRFKGITIEESGLSINDLPSDRMLYKGNYIVNINKFTINKKNAFNNSTVLKYHDTGTASNAFLSLLVPGLGDRRVTYGRKSGLAKGILTYTLIGAGVGCKFLSNSEYEKYHAATEQSEMDTYYKKANGLNQAFYACAAIGATVWIYDIIWVWHKGAQNSRAHKTYKQSHFGLYYHPDFKATGLTYTMNF